VIVLIILGVLLVLIGGCVATCTYIVRKKAKEYSSEAQKNPQMAAISTIVAFAPNLEVVSKDPDSGKITIRNKKTGETVTWNVNDLSAEAITKDVERFSSGKKPTVAQKKDEAATEESNAEPTQQEEQEKPAPKPSAPKITASQASAMVGVLKKFPSELPAYPGGTTTKASLQGAMGTQVGEYVFTTSDPVEKVADYYEQKFTKSGLTIASRQSGSDENGDTATLIATREAKPALMATVSAKTANGKTEVEIAFTKPGS
jgi:hypothetical protein